MRLYVYGGNKYENRRIVGDWNKLPSQDSFTGRQGLNTDEWSFGVGIIDVNPTLILREIQTDGSNRPYPFVIFMDVGVDIWSKFGWNAGQLLKILLESKHFEKLRFEAESISLQELENIFVDVTPKYSQEREIKSLKESIAGSVELENAVCVDLGKSANVDDLAYNIGLLPPCFRCGTGWLFGGTIQQAQEFGANLLISKGHNGSENAKILSQKGRNLIEFCEKNKKALGDLLNTPKFLWSHSDRHSFYNLQHSVNNKVFSSTAANSQASSYSATNEQFDSRDADYDASKNVPQYIETLKNDSKYNIQTLSPKDTPEQILNDQPNLTESVEPTIQIDQSATGTLQFENYLNELKEYLEEIKQGQIRQYLLRISIHSNLSDKDKRLELLEKFYSIPPNLFWQEIFDHLPVLLQDEIVRLAYEYIPKKFKTTTSYFYKVSVTEENIDTLIYKILAMTISDFLLKDTSKKIFQELIKTNGKDFEKNVRTWKYYADGLAEEEKFDWTIENKNDKESKENTLQQDLLQNTFIEENGSPRFWTNRLFIFAILFILVIGYFILYFTADNRFYPLGIILSNNNNNSQNSIPTATPLPLKFSDTQTQELYNKLATDKKIVFDSLPRGDDISAEVFQKLLPQLAEIMNKTRWKLLIEVHTDITGKPDHNLKISTDRGNHIRENLIKLDVKSDQIINFPAGNTDPLIPKPKTTTEDNKNRRIVIKLPQ